MEITVRTPKAKPVNISIGDCAAGRFAVKTQMPEAAAVMIPMILPCFSPVISFMASMAVIAAICGTARAKFPVTAKPVTAPEKAHMQFIPVSEPIIAAGKGESFSKTGDTARKKVTIAVKSPSLKLKSLSLSEKTASMLFSIKFIPFRYCVKTILTSERKNFCQRKGL